MFKNPFPSIVSSSREEIYLNLKALRDIYEKQEAKILNFEEKAILLSTAYVLFGAILYNAMVQHSSNGLRKSQWIPVSLLLSISVAFWLQFLRTLLRYLRISRLSDICWMEQEKLYQRLFFSRTGQDRGQVSSDYQKQGRMTIPTSSSASRQRCWYISVVLSALIIFNFVVLHASLSFLRSSL